MSEQVDLDQRDAEALGAGRGAETKRVVPISP
jgi:hypothetical protein